MNRLNILIVTILFLLTTTGCAQQAERWSTEKSKRMVRISKMAGGYQLRYCYGNQSV